MLETIRKNLKQYREQAGYSQETLSRECNYDKTYIGKIERGDATPSVESLLRIADVLGIKIIKLFEATLSDSPDEFNQQMNDQVNQIGELFVDLFRNSPTVDLITTESGEILQINKTARKLFKVGHNDLPGSNVQDLAFWSQIGVEASVITDLIDIASAGKQASRQTEATFKAQNTKLQLNATPTSPKNGSGQFLSIQVHFVDLPLNQTIVGDHFELRR